MFVAINEPAKATDILRQTAQMAQQLKAPVQRRACADMLAKANASMQILKRPSSTAEFFS